MQLIYSVVYLLYSKVICYTYIYTHIHICTHIFTHTYMYTYIILHCILLQYEYSSLCYTVGICLSIFIYSSSYLLIQNYKFIPPPPPLVIVSLFSFSHSLFFFFSFFFCCTGSLWDLSCLTRDWTHTLSSESAES